MQKIQNPFKKHYFLSFVSEWYAGFDPKYGEWGFGRVEVCEENEPYNIDEWRFCFPPTKGKSFYLLRDKIELENINWFQVQYYRLIIRLFYRISPK